MGHPYLARTVTIAVALLAPNLAEVQPANPATPPAPRQIAASFGYSYTYQDQGCSGGVCGGTTQTRLFDGSVTLLPIEDGYSGTGFGNYTEEFESRESIPGPSCSQGVTTHATTSGRAALEINVQFSIDNDVVGGIDTSALDRDTSVVEVIVSGENLTYTRESQSCGVADNEGHNEASVGFDCHFYGVDLETGGYYSTDKDGDEASGKCTLNIGGTPIKLRIEGLVSGAFGPGGQTPLPESRVVVADLEGAAPLVTPKARLSRSQPGYIKTAAANEDARYEVELDGRPGDLPRLLVVSSLWHEGTPEFAITAARADNGTYVPAYQALCVDDVRGSPCLKWRDEGGGEYVATVDFTHGSQPKLVENSRVVELESWDGANPTAENLAYAAYNYYHTYRAVKYFETLGLRVPWNRLMVRVAHSGGDCGQAYFDSPALKNGTPPAFGGLGAPLARVVADGGGVYICKEINLINSAPTHPLWHELGHYMHWQMYDYDGMPRGDSHRGYANPGTNDSLIEGFATFVAMLINEYYGASPASVIDGDNFELDYRVWGLAGVWGAGEYATGYEEEAVTALLWDFHDRGTEINLGQRINGVLVPVSKVYPMSVDDAAVDAARMLTVIDRNEVRNLVELRTVFGDTSTISRVDLDMLYVNHGIFADIVERNYVHDSVAETIGETGSSSDPARAVRHSPRPNVPGAFVISATDAAYRVAISFDEPYASYGYTYRLDLEGGVRRRFEMPPPYYPATATVTPLDEDGEPLPGGIVVTSDDFWSYVRSNPPPDGVFRTLGR
jgi:hypothetical protein